MAGYHADLQGERTIIDPDRGTATYHPPRLVRFRTPRTAVLSKLKARGVARQAGSSYILGPPPSLPCSASSRGTTGLSQRYPTRPGSSRVAGGYRRWFW